MTISASIRQSSSIGGVSFAESRTLTADGQIVHEVSVPAAEDGSLTTRTDDDEGDITMDESDHTITTGIRINLYWSGGSRRAVIVGTVAGATVPISGGVGDVLPAELTDLTIAVPVELDVSVDGGNVIAVLASLSKLGVVEFIDTDTSEDEITSWNIGEAGVKMWHESDGDTNPFASSNIGRVYVSHGDSTAAATARLGIAYDNVAG